MFRRLFKISIILLLVFGVYKGFATYTNIKFLKDNINVTQVNKKTMNDLEKTNNLESRDDTPPKINIDDITISKNNNIVGSNDLSNSNNTRSTDSKISLDESIDYSVAVSSSLYNAIVSLDQNSKEINIKLINENQVNSYTTDRYINLDDDDIKYLLSNSTVLLNEFKTSSLFEKYAMVKDMLYKYDTNISESDLISIGFAYLK